MLSPTQTVTPIAIIRDTPGMLAIYTSNDLLFTWNDWLLCDIAGNANNPIHRAIFTNFRSHFPRNNIHPVWSADRWQPTYEDDEFHAQVKLNDLWYWKPIMVIPSENP